MRFKLALKFGVLAYIFAVFADITGFWLLWAITCVFAVAAVGNFIAPGLGGRNWKELS